MRFGRSGGWRRSACLGMPACIQQALKRLPFPSCPSCRRREGAKHKAAAVELSTAVAKWLRGSGAADVAIGGITWDKVLLPDKKVG